MEKNQSLYEYLGKAGGSELGKVVYQSAKAIGVNPWPREVSIPTYTGLVMTYPKDFLDVYFKYNSIQDEN
jgi:hypothetical protein|tara:strand:- start:92 stop:301 length:210 start_codon:yes stop_codon:yes gene_type:complete